MTVCGIQLGQRVEEGPCRVLFCRLVAQLLFFPCRPAGLSPFPALSAGVSPRNSMPLSSSRRRGHQVSHTRAWAWACVQVDQHTRVCTHHTHPHTGQSQGGCASEESSLFRQGWWDLAVSFVGHLAELSLQHSHQRDSSCSFSFSGS